MKNNFRLYPIEINALTQLVKAGYRITVCEKFNSQAAVEKFLLDFNFPKNKDEWCDGDHYSFDLFKNECRWKEIWGGSLIKSLESVDEVKEFFLKTFEANNPKIIVHLGTTHCGMFEFLIDWVHHEGVTHESLEEACVPQRFSFEDLGLLK